ncbi:hypothetical protein D3C76_1605210 [compost metagenome]
MSLIGHCSRASSRASRLIPVTGSVGISRAFMPRPLRVCIAPWKLGESTATISPGSHTARMLHDSASWQPVVTTRSAGLRRQPESSVRRAICSRRARLPWMLS